MRPLGERGGTLVSGPGPGWVTAQPGPAVQEGGGGESRDPVPNPQGRSHPVPTCLSGSNQPAWLSKLVQIPKPPLSRETLYPSGRLSPSLSLHVASCAPGSVPRSVGPQPDGPPAARSSFLLPEPWLPWGGGACARDCEVRVTVRGPVVEQLGGRRAVGALAAARSVCPGAREGALPPGGATVSGVQ